MSYLPLNKKTPFCILLVVLMAGINHPVQAQKSQAPSEYVNPFIGTGGHGHTFPGASLPFGMMQLSPDTRLE